MHNFMWSLEGKKWSKYMYETSIGESQYRLNIVLDYCSYIFCLPHLSSGLLYLLRQKLTYTFLFTC